MNIKQNEFLTAIVRLEDDSGAAITGRTADDFGVVKELRHRRAVRTVALQDITAISDPWTEGGIKEIADGWYRLDAYADSTMFPGPLFFYTTTASQHLKFLEPIVVTPQPGPKPWFADGRSGVNIALAGNSDWTVWGSRVAFDTSGTSFVTPAGVTGPGMKNAVALADYDLEGDWAIEVWLTCVYVTTPGDHSHCGIVIGGDADLSERRIVVQFTTEDTGAAQKSYTSLEVTIPDTVVDTYSRPFPFGENGRYIPTVGNPDTNILLIEKIGPNLNLFVDGQFIARYPVPNTLNLANKTLYLQAQGNPTTSSTWTIDRLVTYATRLDAAISAVKAKTDNLPADPAGVSDLADVSPDLADIKTILQSSTRK